MRIRVVVHSACDTSAVAGFKVRALAFPRPKFIGPCLCFVFKKFAQAMDGIIGSKQCVYIVRVATWSIKRLKKILQLLLHFWHVGRDVTECFLTKASNQILALTTLDYVGGTTLKRRCKKVLCT